MQYLSLEILVNLLGQALMAMKSSFNNIADVLLDWDDVHNDDLCSWRGVFCDNVTLTQTVVSLWVFSPSDYLHHLSYSLSPVSIVFCSVLSSNFLIFIFMKEFIKLEPWWWDITSNWWFKKFAVHVCDLSLLHSYIKNAHVCVNFDLICILIMYIW